MIVSIALTNMLSHKMPLIVETFIKYAPHAIAAILTGIETSGVSVHPLLVLRENEAVTINARQLPAILKIISVFKLAYLLPNNQSICVVNINENKRMATPNAAKAI